MQILVMPLAAMLLLNTEIWNPWSNAAGLMKPPCSVAVYLCIPASGDKEQECALVFLRTSCWPLVSRMLTLMDPEGLTQQGSCVLAQKV